MKNKLLAFGLFVTLFSIFCFYSCGPTLKKGPNDRTACVLLKSGLVEVSYSANGGWKPVSAGMELLPTARIRTMPASFCDIQIGGEHRLRIKADSVLLLEKMFLDIQTKDQSTRLMLLSGTLLAKPMKLLKNSDFNVETPSAVVGVRGTEFMVECSKDKDTQVSVLEGSVKVRMNIDTGEKNSKEGTGFQQIKDNLNKDITVNPDQTLEIKQEQAQKIQDKVNDLSSGKINDAQSVNKVIQDVQGDLKVHRAADDVTKQIEQIRSVQLLNTENVKNISTVQIITVPDSCVVQVDSQTVGLTPISKALEPDKSTMITLTKEGYKDSTQTIELKPGENRKLQINLEKVVQVENKKTENAPSDFGVAWKFNSGAPIQSQPSMGNGIIACASAQGTVFAVNGSGEKLWSYNIGEMINMSPVVDNGMVFVSANDGNCCCLSLNDGKLLWKQNVGVVNYAKPLVSGGVLYLGTTAGNFYAISPDSGKILWIFKAESGIYSSAAVRGNFVFIASEDNYLYAINKQSGSLGWKFKTGLRIVSSSPVITGNLVTIGSYDGNFYAMDADTGKEIWKTVLGDKVLASGAVSGNSIFINSASGTLFALDSGSGKVLWKKDFATRIDSSPVVSGSKLILATSSGTVHVLSTIDGSSLWQYSAGGALKGTPAVSGNTVFLGGMDGNLYSFRLP